jgi:hypothetical protein
MLPRQQQLENRDRLLECPISYIGFASIDNVVVTALGTSYEQKTIQDEFQRQHAERNAMRLALRWDEIKPITDPCLSRELPSEMLRPNRAIMHVAKHEITRLADEKTSTPSLLGTHIQQIESLVLKLQDRVTAQRSYFLKKLPGLDAQDITAGLFCPLSLQLLKNPVITKEGITYENECIVDWIKTQGKFDPFTQSCLVESDLIPNKAVKDVIETLDTEDQAKLGIHVCRHTVKATQNRNQLANLLREKQNLREAQIRLYQNIKIGGTVTLIASTLYLADQVMHCHSIENPVRDSSHHLSTSSEIAFPAQQVQPFSTSLVCRVWEQFQPLLWAKVAADTIQDTTVDIAYTAGNWIRDRFNYCSYQMTIHRPSETIEKVAYLRYLLSPEKFNDFESRIIEQDPRYAGHLSGYVRWCGFCANTLTELLVQLEQKKLDYSKVPELDIPDRYLHEVVVNCLRNNQYHLIEQLKFLRVKPIKNLLHGMDRITEIAIDMRSDTQKTIEYLYHYNITFTTNDMLYAIRHRHRQMRLHSLISAVDNISQSQGRPVSELLPDVTSDTEFHAMLNDIFVEGNMYALNWILKYESWAKRIVAFWNEDHIKLYSNAALFYLKAAAPAQAAPVFEKIMKLFLLNPATFPLSIDIRTMTELLKTYISHLSHETTVTIFLKSDDFLALRLPANNRLTMFNQQPIATYQVSILSLTLKQIISNLEKSYAPEKVVEELANIIRPCSSSHLNKLLSEGGLPLSFAEAYSRVCSQSNTLVGRQSAACQP